MKSFNINYGMLLLGLIVLFHEEVSCAVTGARNVSVNTRVTTKWSNLTTADTKTKVSSLTSTSSSITNFSGVKKNSSKSVNVPLTPSSSASSSTSSISTLKTQKPSTKVVDNNTEKTDLSTRSVNASLTPSNSTSSSSFILTSSTQKPSNKVVANNTEKTGPSSRSMNVSLSRSNFTSSTIPILTSSTQKSSTKEVVNNTEKTTSAYTGIEVVAGICIAAASFLIIFIVAFLARYERHKENIKKPKIKVHSLIGELKHKKESRGKPNAHVVYRRESDQEYTNISYSRSSSDFGTRF